jgi:hypothetical protein
MVEIIRQAIACLPALVGNAKGQAAENDNAQQSRQTAIGSVTTDHGLREARAVSQFSDCELSRVV